MDLKSFFYSRPYLAKQAPVPEATGSTYVFRVLAGLKYWLRHEMPLLPAWGVALTSLVLFVVFGYLGSMAEGTLFLGATLFGFVLVTLAMYIAVIVTMCVSMYRLFDRPVGVAIASIFLVGFIAFIAWLDPQLFMGALNSYWETLKSFSWLWYTIGILYGGLIIFAIVLRIIVRVLKWYKKRAG